MQRFFSMYILREVLTGEDHNNFHFLSSGTLAASHPLSALSSTSDQESIENAHNGSIFVMSFLPNGK